MVKHSKYDHLLLLAAPSVQGPRDTEVTVMVPVCSELASASPRAPDSGTAHTVNTSQGGAPIVCSFTPTWGIPGK